MSKIFRFTYFRSVLIIFSICISCIVLNKILCDNIHFIEIGQLKTGKSHLDQAENYNGINVFCWVMTSSISDREASRMWTKNCNGAVHLSFEKTKSVSLDATILDLAESNDSNWMKTVASLTYINEHFSSDFDWFVTANANTHVLIEKLREFLTKFNESEPHYFDYAWTGLLKTGHEGGYVLNGASLSWLTETGLHNNTLCPNKYFGSERLRACLRNIGVYSGIDSHVHSAFVPLTNYLHNSSKLILTWNTLLNRDIPSLAARHSVNCPVKCELTSNKSLFYNADAITFFMNPLDAAPFKQLPEIRFAWQRYVFFNIESFATDERLPKGPSLYNWSMTFQRDSDIKIDYYGQLLRHSQTAEEAKFVDKTVRNKTKMIAWLVSNCFQTTPSRRGEYVEELRGFIPVDQFGTCEGSAKFNYSCPRNPRYYGYWCDSIPFTTDYRFYLAFENAVCRDYVTEKFYQALDRLMVPIVLRKADYEDIAPAGSYIAVDQFRSPKELSEYLHYLANNIDEYIKYFDYTKSYRIVWKEDDMLADGYCRLCRMLHENRTNNLGSNMEEDWRSRAACSERFAGQFLFLPS